MDINSLESFLNSSLVFFEKHPYGKTFLLTFVLILILYVVKKVFKINLSKKQLSSADKKFLTKKVNQYLNYFALLVLFPVWFSHLQVFFVSLFAVAAAIVIAFKELIMCLTGGLLVKNSKPFRVGQRIEINHIRGFVLESSWLVTKVLEIGPEKHSQQTTGDIISIPNSMMLSNHVKNESYFNDYTIKSYQFRVNINDNLAELEHRLLSECNKICSSYIGSAQKSISKFCDREGIAIPSVEPRIKIVFDDSGEKVILLVKIPVSNSSIGDTEQTLNRLFLDWRQSHPIIPIK